MEGSLIASTWGSTTGSDSTVRHLGSTLSWVGTGAKGNTSVSTGATTGVDPTGNDGSGVRTNGTQRAFTEAQLKNVLQAVWVNGGKPDVIMTGSFNKQVFSTFTGRATAIEEAKSKKIVASVDAYESDFGKLKVVANRFQRSRDVLVLEMDKWAVAYLNGRNMISIPLAKTGDSDRRQILAEYALVARNEKSSGGVFDNTAS